MERKEQIRLLKEIMRRLDEGTNVDAGGIRRNPTWVYTCPDLANTAAFRYLRNLVRCHNDIFRRGHFFAIRSG